MVEAAAEASEELRTSTSKVKNSINVEIKVALRQRTIAGEIVLAAGSSFKNKGTLAPDAVIDYLPAPMTFLLSRVPTLITRKKKWSVTPMHNEPFRLWRSRSLPTHSWYFDLRPRLLAC